MKRIVLLFIVTIWCMGMVIPTYAEENQSNSSQMNRTDCIAILDNAGIDYDSTGYISVSDFITADNQMIQTISIVKEYDHYVSKETVLFMDDQDEIINVNRSLSYTSKLKTKTVSNVTITAYYYYATTTSGGNTIKLYRPYKLSSVSSVSQNIYIEYYTYGIKYNLNGVNQTQIGQHTITNSAYPATVNQLYSTNSTYNGYIADSGYDDGIRLRHKVFVTVNGVNKGYFLVTSDSI